MKYTDIIRHFGTQQAAATALGCTRGAVSQWRLRPLIPERMAYRAQYVTAGKLKVKPAVYLRQPLRAA